MRTYTFNECYELLNVDPKTFRGWLKEANIEPDHQVSRADRRIKFLTEEQLNRLAEDHGRLLRGAQQQAEEAISPAAFKLLMDRLARAEEEIARRMPWFEVIERQQTAIQKLEDHVTDLEGELKHYRTEASEQSAAVRMALSRLIDSLREGLQAHEEKTGQALTSLASQSTDFHEQLRALEQKVDQVTGTLTAHITRVESEQVADLDKIKRLRGQIDEHAATFDQLKQSITNLMIVQEGVAMQISTLKDQDIAKLSDRIGEEYRAVWEKVTEYHTSLRELEGKGSIEERRLTELFTLVRDEISARQALAEEISQKKTTTPRARKTAAQ